MFRERNSPDSRKSASILAEGQFRSACRCCFSENSLLRKRQRCCFKQRKIDTLILARPITEYQTSSRVSLVYIYFLISIAADDLIRGKRRHAHNERSIYLAEWSIRPHEYGCTFNDPFRRLDWIAACLRYTKCHKCKFRLLSIPTIVGSILAIGNDRAITKAYTTEMARDSKRILRRTERWEE